jgi:SIR2-like domain
MAKIGIRGADAAGILTTNDFGGWSLSIGAGASMFLFPTWQDLVQELLTSGPVPLSPTQAKEIRQSFPPEALIKASQEQLGLDDDAYRSHLTTVLYSKIRLLSGSSWDEISKCLMARVPGDALPSDWWTFRDFCVDNPTTSSSLALTILDSIEVERGPNSVLSFNAEPLLLASLNAEAAKRFRAKNSLSVTDNSQSGPGVVDRIEGSTTPSRKGRLPYYFCHGFLPLYLPSGLPLAGKAPAAMFDSKMVFSESDYLSLANNVLSWQSSVFTRAAMSERLVFVGLSLTDPNMRRWLAWIHSQRMKEITARTPGVRESTQHIWINKTPGDLALEKWTEAIVAHLGIRLIWIGDWPDVGPTLRLMLNL